MTDKATLLALAERCEKHAAYHFAVAADSCAEGTVDLHNIDHGLSCLARAVALRSQAQKQ